MANTDIARAWWLAPATGCVMLTEDLPGDTLPEIFPGVGDLHFVGIRPAPPEFLGRWFGFYREAGRVVFCQEAHRHPQVDFEKTPVLVAGPFNDWGMKGPRESWLLKRTVFASGEEMWICAVPEARLRGTGPVVAFKFVSVDWHWLKVLSRAPNRIADVAGNENYVLQPGKSGRDVFLFDVERSRGFDTCHALRLNRDGRSRAYPIVPGLAFFDLESAHPLGARVEFKKGLFNLSWLRRKSTVFRFFAPRARSCLLEISAPTPGARQHVVRMKLSDDGVTWETRVPGDLSGWHYLYRIDGLNNAGSTQFDASQRVLDPWALATAGATGPGIVVDRKQLPRPRAVKPFVPPRREDLVILEAHVRDLIARAPGAMSADDRLGFRGLTHWLDEHAGYIHRLGCNALELLPIAQFDTLTREEYHWGYMTTNYFSPCSHYASAPEKGSQIEEFAALVETCHRHGLAVILDVVYNHVGEPAFLLFIDKAYYFHLTPEGALENWSGCGNTLKSGSEMAKRLIVESLVHLIETFDVDGFRFDLAELLTIEVLKEIELAVRAVKPEIILIAEPWSFHGNIAWDLRTTGFSFWSDGFREFIPEYVRGRGNAEGLRYFMHGSLDHHAVFPAQCVNYVESHDDHCWLDKITERPGHDGREPTPNDIRRTHLAAAILMCSIGIPMLAAGQDFLRSKGGLRDTYRRGDVNALDYDRWRRFEATHRYFAGWIALRRSVWGELIRLDRRPKSGYVRLFSCEGCSSAAVLFNADGSGGARQMLFAINPHLEAISITLEGLEPAGWVELADHERVDMNGISTGRFDPTGPRLNLGPLDCGLWVRSR